MYVSFIFSYQIILNYLAIYINLVLFFSNQIIKFPIYIDLDMLVVLSSATKLLIVSYLPC